MFKCYSLLKTAVTKMLEITVTYFILLKDKLAFFFAVLFFHDKFKLSTMFLVVNSFLLVKP